MNSLGFFKRHLTALIFLLSLGFVLTALGAVEEAIFFDARADQTGSTNGGTAIWSLSTTNGWRFWFQNTKHANVSPNGRSVLYVFGNNVYLATIKGQSPKIFKANAYFPVWSPQGDKVALFTNGDELQILSLDGAILNTISNTTTFQSPGRATWSTKY